MQISQVKIGTTYRTPWGVITATGFSEKDGEEIVLGTDDENCTVWAAPCEMGRI